MNFTDQLHRSFKLDKTPKRIICLVPSLSELLVDLGLEDQLVGVTKFCVHPKALRKEKKVVGGTKSVHFDRISGLKPDIILANKEENTPEIVAECDKIAPTHVSDVNTLEDVCEVLQQYGEIFDITLKTGELSLKINQKAVKFRENEIHSPKFKVAYLIWRKPYMAVGSDTFVNHLLEVNGFENIFLDKESRYPEILPQELKKADLVLLSSEPFPFKEKHIQEIATHTDAKVLLVDGEYFSWYGSRLLSAFDYFAELQKELSSSGFEEKSSAN